MHGLSSPPVLVFGLDGTILRCNSFPLWVHFLMNGEIGGLSLGQRVMLSVRTAHLVALRKTRWLTHDELQRRLQMASEHVGTAATDRFVADLLLLRSRPNLRSMLGILVSRGADAILATAAAADYAEPLGQQLGFRHVLATRRNRNARECANSGTAKRDRVSAFLEDAGWHDRPLILFTSQLDDLPLMQESMVVCWFGSIDLLASARSNSWRTKFIDCRDMTGESLYARLPPLCGYAALCGDVARRSSSKMILS
ncbi:MAG TPA: HAD family hydrolase [Acetobacteraceae bacterium]|nr:HAD family hydrolase [Acetobacteraceae bacterium]